MPPLILVVIWPPSSAWPGRTPNTLRYRGVRSAIGRVHRQECQHSADHRVAPLVGDVAVDHVHRRAEQHVVDGLALVLVGGAGVHLVDGLGRLQSVEAAQRLSWRWPSHTAGPCPSRLPCRASRSSRSSSSSGRGENHRLFAVLADVDRHDPFSITGRVSSPSSLLIFDAVGEADRPAISNWKPSMSSTVAAMPPLWCSAPGSACADPLAAGPRSRSARCVRPPR